MKNESGASVPESLSGGTLYLVATPIGNLDDITVRAVKTLEKVDLILAEDTRVSKKLLSLLNIQTPLRSYHDYNKDRVLPGIVQQLVDGTSIALISDAGTPGIADPGFCLTRAAIERKVPVIPIPGPCALVTALTASGLPTDRFVFENFLPVKSGRRCKVLESLRNERRTVIFYETPHRIIRVLEDIRTVLGEIQLVIGREMTKLHEEFLRGTPTELLARLSVHAPRGEMVVVMNGPARTTAASEDPDVRAGHLPVS